MTEEFFGRYTPRKYRKGQVLILNGDVPQSIYYLVSGNVKQYAVDYRGEEVIVNVFKPGAFFPMSFALNGGESQFIFEADTDIEVRQAPAAEVMEFLRTQPEVVLDLLSRVYRGTDVLLGRILQLASGSARSRLAYELSVTARRFGEKSGDSYELTMSEKDLAARAGLSRETVSRVMHKLKDSGLVQMDSGKIVITDLNALDQLHE